jgi:hypothetical protein
MAFFVGDFMVFPIVGLVFRSLDIEGEAVAVAGTVAVTVTVAVAGTGVGMGVGAGVGAGVGERVVNGTGAVVSTVHAGPRQLESPPTMAPKSSSTLSKKPPAMKPPIKGPI